MKFRCLLYLDARGRVQVLERRNEEEACSQILWQRRYNVALGKATR